MSELEDTLVRKHEVLSVLMEEDIALKKTLGDLSAVWTPCDSRDVIVDFVGQGAQETGITVLQLALAQVAPEQIL